MAITEEPIDEEIQAMEEELEEVGPAAVVEEEGGETTEEAVEEAEEDATMIENEDDKEKTEEPATDEKGAEEKKEEKEKLDFSKHQLYIGNIGFETKGEDVKSYFEAFGELSIFTLSRPRQNEKKKLHRGFAFIGYTDPDVAKTVLEKKDHKVDDRELSLSIAKPKTTRFFVGGLDKNQTKDETLREYFEQFGKITDLFNCRTKGFCFVTMVDDGSNVREILDKKKHNIDGKLRDVGRARKRPEGSERGRGRGRRGRGKGRGGRGRGRGHPAWGMGMQAQWGSYGGWNPQAYAQAYNPYGGFGAYGRQY